MASFNTYKKFQTLKITIDGVSVGGRVTRTKRNLEVEITRPYEGLSSGSFYPYYSYMGHGSGPSFLNERGRDQAIRELENLYSFCKKLDDWFVNSGLSHLEPPELSDEYLASHDEDDLRHDRDDIVKFFRKNLEDSN
ncbi:MAG: hypothetical protein ABEK50_00405 [bacterium]